MVALKKAHNEEIERVKASNASKPSQSALSVDQFNAALREEQLKFEQRVVALKKAHNEEIERVKVSKKSQVAVSPVEMRNDVDVDAVRDEAVRGVAGERRALKSMFDSEMRKASERTLTRLQSEVAISEVSSSKKMNDAIRDAQIQFEQRVVALKKAHNEELERLKRSATKDDAPAKIKALEQAHQMAIQTTAAAHATALEDARRESDRRVTQAEDRARDAISKLNESEASKAQLLAQFEAERINVKSNLASEQDAVKQDVTTLKEMYDDMLVRAVAEIQSLAEASKVQLESALKSTTGERNAMYKMMRAEAVKRLNQFDANEEIIDLKKQLSENMAIAEEQLVEAVAELKAENEQLEASLRASSGSPVDTSAQVNDAIRDAQIQFEQRVVALKKAHNEEIERVRAASKASTHAVESPAYWEKKIKDVELMKDAQLKQLKQSYEQKIADLQASSSSSSSKDVDAQVAALNKQLEDAQKEREEAVKRAVAEIVADKDRLQAAVDAAKSQLDASLCELEELKALIKSDTPGVDVSAEITELQRQLRERTEVERDLRNQIASAQQTVKYTSPESITYKFEDTSRKTPENTANVNALEAKISALESQLTEMQKTKREYDAKIESLKASARAAPAVPAATTAGSDESAAKDAMILDLKKQLSEQSWRLQEQKAIAEEQLVEAVAELKAENEQLEASLRASSGSPVDTSAQVNDAIRDAQIQFEQRVVALKKAHNEEIERVRAASKASTTTGVSDRSAEIDALNKKLQDAENDAEEQVEAAVATILADNAKLQAAAAAEKAQLDASLRELEELKASMSKASGSDGLSSVVSDLQAQLSKRSSIELELRGQVDAAKAELQSLKTASKNGVKYTLPQFIKYTFEGGSTDDKLMKAQQAKISALESQLTEMQKTKREYDAKIESLKASARAAPAVPAATTAGSDESAAKDAMILDLKKQLSEQSWRLQEQKAIAEEQLVEAVASIQAFASSELAQRDASSRSSAGERRALYAMMRNEAIKQSADAMVEFTAEVATAEAQSSIFWEQKIREVEAAKDAQIDRLKQEYQGKIDALQSSTAWVSSDDDEMKKIKAQLAASKSSESELRKRVESTKKDLEDLKQKSKGGIKYTLPQTVTYKFTGNKVDASLEKERDALQAQVTRLESQLDEMQKSKRLYEQTIANMKSTSKTDTETATIDDQVAALKKQLADANESAERELIQAVAEIQASAEADRVALVALVKSEADDRVSQESKLFQEEKEALITAQTLEIETLQNAMKTSLASDETTKVKQAEDLWKAKLEEVERSAKIQADEIAAEYEATVKRLELQLEEVSEGYESTIKKLNKTLKRTATETEAELRLEVTEARKELDAFKRKQQQKREKSVVKYTLPQSVTYKFEGSTGEVKRLKKQRDALQEKLEKLEAEFATQAKRSSPDVEKHIFDLEAQIKAVRAERDQDVLSVTTRLQSEKLDSERRLEKELEKARKGMQKAEEKYKAVLDKAKGDRGGIFASIIGASQGQDASLDAVNAQIKDQTVLLSAAETEARDAQEREVKLREEISRLTLEFEQKSSASANEIAALKAELKDAVSNASSTFAAESETTVKEYKQRISELESKLKSGDDTVAAIAKLQADAQEQLAVTVARLNEERERAVADAETKYALDLARLTENASASFDEDDEMTAAVAQMLRKMAKLEQERDAWQFDSVTWKDQAKSYEANVRSLESERADILVKYQNSQAMLGSRISEMNAMKEKHNDEIVRAVAQTTADATLEFNQKIQESKEHTREVEVLLAALREDFKERVRDSAQLMNKQLKSRERELEKQIRRAHRDYAEQAKKMENVQYRLASVQADEANVRSLESERADILVKYQNSQAMLGSRISEMNAMKEKHNDEIVRAVAQTTADATLEFNQKIQESKEHTREVEVLLAALREDFKERVRDSAQLMNKQLKSRERELEKQIRRAHRDYAEQAKKMENVQYRLASVQAEFAEAEAKWSRSMLLMKEDFERRLKSEQVTLAEKIAFYEQRVGALTDELDVAKKQSSSSKVVSETSVQRPLFEFNKGKVAAERAAREDAERKLRAAQSEMVTLRDQLLAAKEEATKAKEDAALAAEEAALAAEEAAKTSAPSLFERLFGASNRSMKETNASTPTESVIQKSKPAQSPSKVATLERDLEAAVKKLSEFKTAQKAEIEAVEKAMRIESESKLKALESKVSTLENQLANSEKIANQKLASAMEAAKAERDRMEKTLRTEIAAAKKLTESAKLAAQREYIAALREAETTAKKALRDQLAIAAAERSKSEAALRATAKKANDKLKAKIANFENMLNDRDLEIEAKFNAQFDKLVVDFRQEVETLQRAVRDAEKRAGQTGGPPQIVEKVVEKIVEVEKTVEKEDATSTGRRGDADAYAEEIAKTQASLKELRERSEIDIAKLRESYEARLRDTIAAKDAALKASREKALKIVAEEKSKAEKSLRLSVSDREKQLEADRLALERSFEQTATERDEYAVEIKRLRVSLDEAKKRLRDFVNLSDEELKVLEESKKVAGELDDLKSKYAESMGISVQDVEAEDVVKSMTISSLRSVITRKTNTNETKKTAASAVDYFTQLLDMSNEDK